MLLTARTSKSKEIAERIYREIAGGRLLPNEKLPGVRQMAERFGVGRQVILSAFQLLEKNGILDMRIGNGTFVKSKLPQGMRTEKRLRIGFLSWKQDLSYRFNLHLYQELLQCSRNNHCEIELGIEFDRNGLNDWIHHERLDGLIVTGLVDDALIRDLNELEITCLIHGNYHLTESCNRLESQVEEIIYQEMNRIIETSHTGSIGIIGNSPKQLNITQIRNGIVRVLREHSLPVREEFFILNEQEDGYAGMEQLYRKPDDLPGLLFLSANAFPGAARYVFENNLQPSERPGFVVGEQDGAIYPDLINFKINRVSIPGYVGLLRLLDIYHGRLKTPWHGYVNDYLNGGNDK